MMVIVQYAPLYRSAFLVETRNDVNTLPYVFLSTDTHPEPAIALLELTKPPPSKYKKHRVTIWIF